MPKAIHFICRFKNGRYKNLDRLEGTRYRSYRWLIPADVAHDLVGGWIYLHEAKGHPSGFGGVVRSVEFADPPGENGKFAIIFDAQKSGHGQPWRGASHGMAWTSGPVDLSFEHEKAI